MNWGLGLIIIIIDKFCEYIIKNMHNNNENNVSFIRNKLLLINNNIFCCLW